jgi:uncharacterized membrane protein YfcA
LLRPRVHQQGGQVDWVVVRRLWWGSLPVAILIVTLVALGSSVQKLPWLTQAIGLVVVLTGVGLLAAPRLLQAARERRIGNPSAFKAKQPALTVIAGAVLGLCVALTSVGAGAIGSVVLLYLYPLRMTPHRLVATDLVHAIPLAVVAGTGYLLAGLVDGGMLVSMLAGSLPAVALGSLLARRLSSRWLQLALGLVLIAAGAKTLS